MTREEFESLQVGDVVEYREKQWVIFDAMFGIRRGVERCGWKILRFDVEHVEFLKPISRVITRENIK